MEDLNRERMHLITRGEGYGWVRMRYCGLGEGIKKRMVGEGDYGWLGERDSLRGGDEIRERIVSVVQKGSTGGK